MKKSRRKRKPYWFEPTDGKIRLHPAYRGQPTGFEQDTFWDYVTWLDEKQLQSPALRAVVKADATGDAAPVNEFLKSEPTLSSSERAWIDDYKARSRSQKSGPKPIPVYARSLQDAVRSSAVERAQYLMRESGMSQAEAFDKAARERGLKLETLLAFHNKRLGSSGRMAQRRKANFPARKAWKP